MEQAHCRNVYQAVAVIGKGQLEQVLGESSFVKGYELVVIFLIGIPYRLLVIAQVKEGVFQISLYFSNGGFCYLFVKNPS